LPITVHSCIATTTSTTQSCIMFANVYGQEMAGQSFWQSRCGYIPEAATMIRVDVGGVSDFFRPRAGFNFCEMLTVNNKKFWSNDGHTLYKPAYLESHLGGSARNWPNAHIPHDGREYFSFWGSQSMKGGCCSQDLSTYFEGWGLPVAVYSCNATTTTATTHGHGVPMDSEGTTLGTTMGPGPMPLVTTTEPKPRVRRCIKIPRKIAQQINAAGWGISAGCKRTNP